MPNSRGVWLSVVFVFVAVSLVFFGVTPEHLLNTRVEFEHLVARVPQKVPSTAPTLPSTLEARSHTHPLLSVVDGDTIHALHGEDDVTVRMIGIDAPETGKGNRPKGCFGDEATHHLTELLHGEPVSLVPDPTQSSYDKYGRALMYVEQDGKDINAMMIADGYAREYTYRVPYERQALYRSLEDDARYAKKGLWATHACGITSP